MIELASYVRYLCGAAGKKAKITVRKEAILTAGAIHTPRLLMLSGGQPTLNRLVSWSGLSSVTGRSVH